MESTEKVKYQLIEHDNSFHENHWAIQLEDGNYQGVVYQYDTVSFEENDTNGDVVLSFNTITLENPNELDLKTEEFESIVGSILTKIIEEHLENMDDENGTGNTETPAE